jgi:hypothetical protein
MRAIEDELPEWARSVEAGLGFVDVRFSKRPVLVKHFQAIHHLGESTSLAGSRFSPESAPGPFHHGIRGRGGTIFGSALPSE